MRHFERILGPHPEPYHSDEVGEAHYLRLIERRCAKGEVLAVELRKAREILVNDDPDWFKNELASSSAALAEWEKP